MPPVTPASDLDPRSPDMSFVPHAHANPSLVAGGTGRSQQDTHRTYIQNSNAGYLDASGAMQDGAPPGWWYDPAIGSSFHSHTDAAATWPLPQSQRLPENETFNRSMQVPGSFQDLSTYAAGMGFFTTDVPLSMLSGFSPNGNQNWNQGSSLPSTETAADYNIDSGDMMFQRNEFYNQVQDRVEAGSRYGPVRRQSNGA